MYNNFMRLRKLFCIAVFSILVVFSLSSQNDALAEGKPFHETLTEDLGKTWVWDCVGNEDNSLFLMHVTDEIEWKNAVYYFLNGRFMADVRIHKLWDSGRGVGNIVFSPFSKQFYFCSAWVNSPGLWIASQTEIKDNPLKLDSIPMDKGRGYLAVNKTGVWLLHDKEVQKDGKAITKGELYKVEDNKGKFELRIPSSVNQVNFNSFYNFMNESRPDSPELKEHEQCFKFTDYTLLICDEDESSWWVFNCLTEKLKKYESLELAKKAAAKIDRAIARKQKVLEQLSLIGVLLVILMIFTVVLILVLKKLLGSQKAASRIEHNKMIFDIQEKERAKISRDIHDSVVQDIRVLRLETENLVVDQTSKTRQTKIEDLATDCIIKLRNICYNLTPAELASHSEGDSTQLELISIINSLVQQFSSRSHIPCVFKVEEDFEYPVLEKEKTQNLFRVIQEALTNIEKHSYATQASIFIKNADSSGGSKRALLIYITDDGIGCNQNELAKKLKSKEHLGLRGMKDRMELIGGQIEFFTAQNDGMEIKIELPLESAK